MRLAAIRTLIIKNEDLTRGGNVLADVNLVEVEVLPFLDDHKGRHLDRSSSEIQ